ncbi:MAG TPA: DUF3828 domain-containing protein [Blastocatellia bacterium]
MKPRVGLLMLFVLMAAAPSLAQAVAAPAKTPEVVIHEFYKWYVQALNQNKDPLTGERPVMRRYVTARLLAAIDRLAKVEGGLDADYFIAAQDWDKDWGKNITVSNVVVKNTVTTAKVALKGKEMRHTLRLTLKQEAGAWKIDRVKDLDN